MKEERIEQFAHSHAAFRLCLRPYNLPPSSGSFLTGSCIAFQNGLSMGERVSETWNHLFSLLPLFPTARYQNELAGVDTELLAERFYYQALSVAPQIGK